VLDYVWLAELPFSQDMHSGAERQPRLLHRMEIDLNSGKVSDSQFSDIYCEFTRMDDRRCGLEYRYGFAAASDIGEWQGSYHGYNSTARFDLQTGRAQLCKYGDNANAGEPVYVPVPGKSAEEDGYLMCFVHNPGEGAFLAVLSAADLSQGPVAKIHIPGRVPNGFHANWMAGMILPEGER
jgi:carotenoid cleavage dioxygenase-like enzyme